MARSAEQVVGLINTAAQFSESIAHAEELSLLVFVLGVGAEAVRGLVVVDAVDAEALKAGAGVDGVWVGAVGETAMVGSLVELVPLGAGIGFSLDAGVDLGDEVLQDEGGLLLRPLAELLVLLRAGGVI